MFFVPVVGMIRKVTVLELGVKFQSRLPKTFRGLRKSRVAFYLHVLSFSSSFLPVHLTGIALLDNPRPDNDDVPDSWYSVGVLSSLSGRQWDATSRVSPW